MAFDAAKFRSRLVYEGLVTPEEVARDLREIREQDATAEARRSTFAKVGWLALVVGFLGFLIVGAFIEDFGDATSIALLACASVFLLGIAALVYRATQGKFDYEDRRYLLLDRILPMLATDLPRDARVRVRMDLSAPTKGHKAKGEGKAGTWKVKYFEDPWLTLSGQFLDGTKFELQATEKFQKRSKWKTSASGKMKHKSKTKSATVVSLRLAVKPKRYPALARVSDQLASAVQLPRHAVLKSAKANANALALKVQLKAPWNCAAPGEKAAGVDGQQLVASLFMSAYQVLNLAKAVAKGRPRVV